VFRPTLSTPVFVRGKPPKMRINKSQSLEVCTSLMRVCFRCGHFRKTSLPNN
jgi:hypothetical protein